MQMEIFMTAIGRMTKRMAMESTLIQMVPNMKVIGLTTSSMVKAWKNGPMVRSMKARTNSGRKTDMGNSCGLTCLRTRVTFWTTTSMVSVSTGGPTAESTRATGSATKCTDEATSVGQTGGSTRVTTTMTRSRGTAYLRGLTVASIMELGSMESRRASEYTRTPMKLSNSATGKMANGSSGSPRRNMRTMREAPIITND